jgi:hypothetical protein
MDRGEDLRVGFAVDAIGQPRQPGMKLLPELQPGFHRQRQTGGTEAGDVLVADPVLNAAGFDDRHLKPASGGAKPGEHPGQVVQRLTVWPDRLESLVAGRRAERDAMRALEFPLKTLSSQSIRLHSPWSQT